MQNSVYQTPIAQWEQLIRTFLPEDYYQLSGLEQHDPDLYLQILTQFDAFVRETILPLNASGDEEGVSLENDVVTTPKGFKEAYQAYVEQAWPTMDFAEEDGGQGLPKIMSMALDESLGACNLAFKLYTELTRGAAHLLKAHGTDTLKAQYLPKMISGEWTGTMCLTESHCGTDLGLLRTKAKSNGDGSYAISGQKIFITSGEHDLAENIIHMVLARLPDAPAGVKGISLFLVPKYIGVGEGDNATISDRNTVSVGNVEEKMGIHGSPTCVMNFDQAQGWLVGPENRGLVSMFTMMNLERLSVGMQGLGMGDHARQQALSYAQERLQGRAPAPWKSGDNADPLIHLPQVRASLLDMRVEADALRFIAFEAGLAADFAERHSDTTTREQQQMLLALYTPVVKSALTDYGLSTTLQSQQVFGGHGFIREYGVEQLVRDVRITPIYEGTNGVQALDLISRKIQQNEGKILEDLVTDWKAEPACNNDYIEQSFQQYCTELTTTTAHLLDNLSSPEASVLVDAMSMADDFLKLLTYTLCARAHRRLLQANPDQQVVQQHAVWYYQRFASQIPTLASTIKQPSDILATLDDNNL
jgi:alkylation response protein AidB-like acyl-CoA dehydrogenase